MTWKRQVDVSFEARCIWSLNAMKYYYVWFLWRFSLSQPVKTLHCMLHLRGNQCYLCRFSDHRIEAALCHRNWKRDLFSLSVTTTITSLIYLHHQPFCNQLIQWQRKHRGRVKLKTSVTAGKVRVWVRSLQMLHHIPFSWRCSHCRINTQGYLTKRAKHILLSPLSAELPVFIVSFTFFRTAFKKKNTCCGRKLHPGIVCL